MRFEITLQSSAPPEAIFALLSEPRLRPQWQRSLDTIEDLSAGPTGRGTSWSEQPKGGPRFRMRVCAYRAPRRWAESLRSRFARGIVALRLDPQATGTHCTLSVRVRLRGVARPLTWPATWVLRREMRRDLRGALAQCEAAASGATRGSSGDP